MHAAPLIDTPAGPCPAFEVVEPREQTTPLVICSPHSGRAYPSSLLAATRLKGGAIRRSEDLFVDQLFDFAPALGAPLLTARFPRAFLDVNREPYELDPDMFDGPLPDYVNSHSLRVAAGLGTVPRIVAERQPIYADRQKAEEALERVETIYRPFHATLEALLERTRRRFGIAILLDCHSMPSTIRTVPGGLRPDAVVGDRFGTSAGSRYVGMVVNRLAGLGWSVVRNKPYAGGFITERYGQPGRGIHAIQIELNRGLYADEVELTPHAGFAAIRASLLESISFMAGELEAEIERPAAAE